MISRILGIVAGASTLFLTACAPGFPENGQPSAFDGNWSGNLATKSIPCDDMTITAVGEVRYGFVIGDVFENGHRRYQIWGPIGPDNRLAASIGMSGVAGASADILFDQDKATGTWKSSTCKGEVSLARQ